MMTPAGRQDYPGPVIGSPAFLAGAVRVPASKDPDTATAQTVRVMVGHIDRSANDPLVLACARAAVDQWRGGFLFWNSGLDPWQNALAIAESLFWWAKHQMRFVHHSKQILVWLNERDQLQLLIEPSVLVRMRRMEGDCAIYTMLICAMLRALGLPYEIQTLAVNPRRPNVFSHVFLRLVLPDGRRVPIDASHGGYVGWMVPEQDILRSQVWDSAGNPIEDRAGFEGLHGYVSTPDWGWGCGGGFGNCGLGDDATQAAIDLSQIPTDLPSGSTLADLGTMGPTPLPGVDTTTIGATPGYVAPSQSSAAWGNFATQLAKSGMTLAEINAIQPGTVVGANGSILRQATGLPVPVGYGSSLTTAFGAGSPSLLMYAGLGLLAIVAVGMLKK